MGSGALPPESPEEAPPLLPLEPVLAFVAGRCVGAGVAVSVGVAVGDGEALGDGCAVAVRDGVAVGVAVCVGSPASAREVPPLSSPVRK